MVQTKPLLKLIAILFIFSTACLSQTRADLNRDYGEPRNGVYSLKPGIISKVNFGKDGQASDVEIFLDKKNVFGREQVKFIDHKTASEITEKFTAQRRLGKLVGGITFSAGCTSIENSRYENVRIGSTLLCFPEEKPEIVSIHIHWKKLQEQ